MCRDLEENYYYKLKGGRIPLKWTAPEAIFYKKYTTKSDVWSYGMVMYEIWSLGHTPFEDFSDIDQVGATVYSNSGTCLVSTWFSIYSQYKYNTPHSVPVYKSHIYKPTLTVSISVISSDLVPPSRYVLKQVSLPYQFISNMQTSQIIHY